MFCEICNSQVRILVMCYMFLGIVTLFKFYTCFLFFIIPQILENGQRSWPKYRMKIKIKLT